MSRAGTTITLALTAIVATTGLAACTGSGSGSNNPSSTPSANAASSTRLQGNAQGTGNGFAASTPLNPSSVKGGTLNVGVGGDVDYMDPARTYEAFSWDIHQLINRALLTFPDGIGQQGLVPTGDIATGPAKGEKGNTVWSYTLKSGIKFQDGTAVTSKNVKYAIERTFATSVINGGPPYFATFLCPGGETAAGACTSYGGPYGGPSSIYGLSTVKTPSANKIVFDLNQPFAEWNYVMTLLGTSPVEPSVDQNPKTGGANYNNHVQATGPYEIASYVPNKHIDLVRNSQWSATTDLTRTALPDKVDITTSFDLPMLDEDIVANTEDLDVGSGVQPTTQVRILKSAALKARSLDPITGFTNYISILSETPPFNNVHCRRAIEWAMSKTEQQDAAGGVYGGAIATTLGPPTLAGWKYFNPYPTTPAGSANIANAKRELAACGKPNGFHTTIVTFNSGSLPQQAQFLQSDLKAVGIIANIKQFDLGTYFSAVVGVPANIKTDGYGLAFTGWGPDWPAPYGFFDAIVDPRKILAQGNSNVGACNDPHITSLINLALKQTTAASEYRYWQQVDQTVLGDVCDVPSTYAKALDLFSNRLTNVYIEPELGKVDLRTLGVE